MFLVQNKDNAPSHAGQKHHKHGMACMLQSRICGSIIMRKVYVAGKQFNSKQELWNAIQAAAKEISAKEVSKLTSSTRVRFTLVIM
jgi:nitrogen fixation protein FixH